MPLEGTNISRYHIGINIGNIPGDFVVVEITGGRNYVDPTARAFIEAALEAGKLVGLYHFAQEWGHEGEDVIDEVINFLTAIKPYLEKVILILGWERENTSWNTVWAKRWLDLLTNNTGVKPLICMSAITERDYDWWEVVRAGYKLWLVDMDYVPGSTKHWTRPIILQYSSKGDVAGFHGKVNKIRFFGLRNDWDKLTRLVGCAATKCNDHWSNLTTDNKLAMQVPAITRTVGRAEEIAFEMVSLSDIGKQFNPDKKEKLLEAPLSKIKRITGENVASNVTAQQGTRKSYHPQDSKIPLRRSRPKSYSETVGLQKIRKPHQPKKNKISPRGAQLENSDEQKAPNEKNISSNVAVRPVRKLYHPRDIEVSPVGAQSDSYSETTSNRKIKASEVVGLQKIRKPYQLKNNKLSPRGTQLESTNDGSPPNEKNISSKVAICHVRKLYHPRDIGISPVRARSESYRKTTPNRENIAAHIVELRKKCFNQETKLLNTSQSMIKSNEDTVPAQGAPRGSDNEEAKICTNVAQIGKDIISEIAMLPDGLREICFDEINRLGQAFSAGQTNGPTLPNDCSKSGRVQLQYCASTWRKWAEPLSATTFNS